MKLRWTIWFILTYFNKSPLITLSDGLLSEHRNIIWCPDRWTWSVMLKQTGVIRCSCQDIWSLNHFQLFLTFLSLNQESLSSPVIMDSLLGKLMLTMKKVSSINIRNYQNISLGILVNNYLGEYYCVVGLLTSLKSQFLPNPQGCISFWTI